MLIPARHFGESLENYTALEHPVQQRILSVFAEMCGVETSEVQLAVDGCGVPVHALPLYRLAQGYARLSPRFSPPPGPLSSGASRPP